MGINFKQKMLSQNDVAKLEPVKNKDIVRVYITRDSLDKKVYKDMLEFTKRHGFLKN